MCIILINHSHLGSLILNKVTTLSNWNQSIKTCEWSTCHEFRNPEELLAFHEPCSKRNTKLKVGLCSLHEKLNAFWIKFGVPSGTPNLETNCILYAMFSALFQQLSWGFKFMHKKPCFIRCKTTQKKVRILKTWVASHEALL